MSEQPDLSPVDMANSAMDDASDKESYHGYSVDDEDQPQDTGHSLTDARGLPEPLDEGYSPPEKWSAGQGWGNTPLEEQLGETLDQRLEQEVPEPDPYEQAASEDLDHLIDEINSRNGCRTTVTFDKAASKSSHFTELTR